MRTKKQSFRLPFNVYIGANSTYAEIARAVAICNESYGRFRRKWNSPYVAYCCICK